MLRFIQCHHIPNQLSATFLVSYTDHFTNTAQKRSKGHFFYFLHAFRYEMKSNYLLPSYPFGRMDPDWAWCGNFRPLWQAKCEKENYRALSRAKHSIRLFWPKFGFWALKENLVGVGSFKACCGKRYVAVGNSRLTHG